MKKFVINRFFWVFPLASWTLLTVTSLQWNLNNSDAHSKELVLERARLVYETISSLRFLTPPQDVIHSTTGKPPSENTTSVKNRTHQPPTEHINQTTHKSAAFTHDITNITHERNNMLIHITSLTPINPNNIAQPWEAQALRRLAQDKELNEWSIFSGEGEEQEFRYIAPLATERECLKCHVRPNQKNGDIQGGISIKFPSAPFLVSEKEHTHNLVIVHVGIWFILTALTLFALSRHRTQLLKQQALIEQQDAIVETRTAQLQQEVLVREEAEERFKRFIESSGEGILVVDHNGRCTLSNVSALNMLGYTDSSQVIGRTIHDVLCPHNDANSAKHIKPDSCEACLISHTMRTSQTVCNDDNLFRHADGHIFPVAINSSPIHVDGHTLGAVITFADISKRKHQELELRKLSQAVEHSPSTTMITNSDGVIEYVNRKFSYSSGYAAEEVIGKKPNLMQSGKTPVETYTSLWQHIRSGKVWHGEILNRKKCGELFWEDVSISPINDADGIITHYVAVKEDISERKRQEEIAWRLANFDSLTGLINRHYFLSLLEHCTMESSRYENAFTLLFIDLDGFKLVNDTLGHDAGDELLTKAAGRLKQSVRESDTVARLGGDEFTIILPMVNDTVVVEKLTEKLLLSLNKPFLVKGRSIHISASIGLASYPAHGLSSVTLLNHADAAMYQAKSSGKNTYHWYRE